MGIFWICAGIGTLLFLGQLGHGLEVYYMNKASDPKTVIDKKTK